MTDRRTESPFADGKGDFLCKSILTLSSLSA